jgi:hypothetical protein
MSVVPFLALRNAVELPIDTPVEVTQLSRTPPRCATLLGRDAADRAGRPLPGPPPLRRPGRRRRGARCLVPAMHPGVPWLTRRTRAATSAARPGAWLPCRGSLSMRPRPTSRRRNNDSIERGTSCRFRCSGARWHNGGAGGSDLARPPSPRRPRGRVGARQRALTARPRAAGGVGLRSPPVSLLTEAGRLLHGPPAVRRSGRRRRRRGDLVRLRVRGADRRPC